MGLAVAVLRLYTREARAQAHRPALMRNVGRSRLSRDHPYQR